MSANILLVEDDPAARLALSRMLESVGYQVATAPDGSTAITMLSETSFDVVVSDMRLPDIDGVEVLQVATSLPFPPSVVLLTGYGTLDTAIAALRAGASDYLLKPCAPQTLLAGVAGAIQRRAERLRQADTLRHLAEGMAQLQSQLLAIGVAPGMGSPPPTPTPQIPTNSETITIGPLQIGRFPYEVRLHGEPLHITPIEHSILRCLAEAGGQVISYRDIVRRTHGYTAPDAEAQTLLKSHVRNLRIKMGADMIVSIRNAGYRFVILSDDDPEL